MYYFIRILDRLVAGRNSLDSGFQFYWPKIISVILVAPTEKTNGFSFWLISEKHSKTLRCLKTHYGTQEHLEPTKIAENFSRFLLTTK